MERILVIKLGALGDFVQAMGAFKAIRKHHITAEITLMTTPFFKEMALDCGYFDKIWIDERKPFFNIPALLTLRRKFRDGQFNRVYDLQCVSRTNFYHKYLLPRPRPQWSGLAEGCSHPHTDLNRPNLHTYDRHRNQLTLAGIRAVPDPDLDWVDSDIKSFKLKKPYVLLIPGAAPGGSKKQWPASSYGELAAAIYQKGFTPVIVGTKTEAGVAKTILASCPEAIDLTGQTGLYDIVGLAREATCAVGNDTGPTHMVAQSHCLTTVLFSDHSDPSLFGPRGANVKIIQSDSLADLNPNEVIKEVLRQARAEEKKRSKKVS